MSSFGIGLGFVAQLLFTGGFLVQWVASEEPRASARGFFQRKSHYDLKANGVQNHTAIAPRPSERARSGERGILAFSREKAHRSVAPVIFRYLQTPRVFDYIQMPYTLVRTSVASD